MNITDIGISQFDIDSYNEAYSLWQQCEGVGLSDPLEFLQGSNRMRGQVIATAIKG